jgi:hypothetical protein
MKSHHKIYIKSVNKISPQGRDKQSYIVQNSGTGELLVSSLMAKNKELGVTETFKFQDSPERGKLITGLEELVTNPYKDLEMVELRDEYHLDETWDEKFLGNILKKDKITRQTWYEILDGVSKNYYTSRIKGNKMFSNSVFSTGIKDSERSYLQKFSVILYDGVNVFTSKTSRGRMAIQLVKSHTLVAPSKDHANNSIHHFYIADEDEAEQEKLKKDESFNEAIYELYGLLKKQNEYKIYQFTSLLTNHVGSPIVKGKVNSIVVNSALNKYIKNEKDKYQSENIEKFMETLKMLKKKDQAGRFEVTFLVRQALNTNTLGVRDGYYLWHSKVNEPAVYKFKSHPNLVNYLLQEYGKYNPKELSISNYYSDLLEEVKRKGVRIE